MSEASLRAIVRLLRQRKSNGYVAGQTWDGEHLALVVEGGGMRGVASGGMVTGLEQLGLTECFDSIHGSSAGAAAAAYFCCGRAASGTRIYYEDLTDQRFISRMRFATGRVAMDTAYLVDDIMQFGKPLDFEGVRQREPRLHIVMTDIDNGEAFIVNRFGDYRFYRECLKASVTLPLVAGGPKLLEGRRLMDGGLTQQIPIQSAISSGATKILALMTRRHDERLRPEFSTTVWAQSLLIQSLYGGMVGALIRARSRQINDSAILVERGVTDCGVELAGIRLHNSIDYIHRLTQDGAKLELAADVSRQHVLDVFAAVGGQARIPAQN